MLVFALLATANSGGYRYGVGDQAFYIPATELRLTPDAFPRDRALIAPGRPETRRARPSGRALRMDSPRRATYHAPP